MPYKNKSDLYKAQLKHRQRNRAMLIDYLKSHPCVDCGNKDYRVLDFDHVNGIKSFSIAKGVGSSTRSWASIQKEIDKCQVRCSNCHRIRHFEKNQWHVFPENILDKKPIVLIHGTRNTYRYHKCRCDECRKANTEYSKKLRLHRTNIQPSPL